MSGPTLRFILPLAAAVGVAFAAAAPRAEFVRPEVEIGWTDQPPDLDGRIDPDEWRVAAYVDDFTQFAGQIHFLY